MKALVIYQYNEEAFGYRPHMFDWSVGDRIICDGKRATIIKVVEATKENASFLSKVINKCNRYSGDGLTRTQIGIANDGRLAVKQTTKVWSDGTGYGYFREAIDLLPDFEF